MITGAAGSLRSTYEWLGANILENLEAMDKILDTHNKVNHKYRKNMTILIIRNKTQLEIKSLSAKKSPGLDVITVEFY